MIRSVVATLAIVSIVSICLPLSRGASAADRIVLPAEVVPLHYDLAIAADPARAAFDGNVQILVDVARPTAVVTLNAADIAITRWTMSGGVPAKPPVFDTQRETVTFAFRKPLAAGHHVLAIAYSGKVNVNAAGLFGLEYDTAEGKARALFTQFENSDARRFMPCWDEPNRKATFTLTVTVPQNLMAVSNMPVAEAAPLGNGLKRVRFAPSPRMSSYLLFFGLGDFERVSQNVNGVDVGVIYKRGDAAKTAFALDAATHILSYYEDYFGTKFPLPKLDLVAAPGQSQFFGAMENWGAIFYFERAVLIDPKISTESDKRGVYVSIAHETAHQWFGDLVTMDWWDDLWLNEGFAEWMETKAADHFHPEWHMWLDSLALKEQGLRIDARAGTHPIVQPIADVLQADQAFDDITYDKGQAVIRMLEAFDGADNFRGGVRLYIAKHAYGNAVTDDLWRELDKKAPQAITGVAHDFTLQAGVPLIRVTRTATGIHLTQDRFAADESGAAPQTWHVPVIARTLGGAEWKGIVSADQPADLAAAPDAATVVNAGQAGYFRTLYAPEALAPIAANFSRLDAADQIGLLNDTSALGYSGYEKLSDFLGLARNASPALDPSVLSVLAARVEGIGQLYRGLPGEAAYRTFAQRLLEPLLAAVGWDGKPGESQNVTLARNDLIAALSDLGDAAAIAEAKARFEGFVKNPESLSGDLRRNVLRTVAMNADAAIWEELHTLARTTKDSLAKREYYTLLGLARDPALAKRALDLVLTDEAPVTVRPTLVAGASVYNPEMAFDFLAAHADAINAMLEPDSRGSFAPRIAGESYDPATIAKLNAYAQAHIPENARQDVTKAAAAIVYYAGIRKDRLPEVDAWLKGK
ncbi:MAG: M1 family metallopeptidase [Rhizomicrobium sp.]